MRANCLLAPHRSVEAAGCAQQQGSSGWSRLRFACAEPKADIESEKSAVATLREQLTLFFPMDESEGEEHVDRVNGLTVVLWQRTGFGAYAGDASGTSAVPGAVGFACDADLDVGAQNSCTNATGAGARALGRSTRRATGLQRRAHRTQHLDG